MNIQRIFGKSTKEALARVKDALGEEAVILANRSTDEGVEIMACCPDDFERVVPGGLGAAPAQDDVRAERPEVGARQQGKVVGPSDPTPDARFEAVMAELKAMRSLLATQQMGGNDFSWASGAGSERIDLIADQLRDLGFSKGLSQFLANKAPTHLGKAQAITWAGQSMAANLRIQADDRAVLDAGGVFALVGPTGVGKTTTTAKLAARSVMRHGRGRLALITTDAYRIGAQEQLRIFGKILGSMVHSVRDEADLNIALDDLASCHTVLIDTVGMSQRDQLVAEQIGMLSRTKRPVQRLLCLSAASTLETLDEVIQAYRGSGLAGVVLTKVDEAPRLGHVLDVLLRHRLPVAYLGTGQRVPEDLELPRLETLMSRSLPSPSQPVASTDTQAANARHAVPAASHQASAQAA